jgi:hypothetical protein
MHLFVARSERRFYCVHENPDFGRWEWILVIGDRLVGFSLIKGHLWFKLPNVRPLPRLDAVITALIPLVSPTPDMGNVMTS